MQTTAHPRVMVAEASADTRDLLRYWLERKRCRVVEATNGQEAVAMTRDDCPDLILISEKLPVLDGLAAVRRISQDAGDCHIPIVCMSTYPTKEAQAIAFAAGCKWFISQPIDFNLLDDLLETLLPAPAASDSAG